MLVKVEQAMRWQILFFLFILAWNMGSLIWLRRVDKADRDAQAMKLARINLPITIVLLIVILITFF